MNQKIGTKLGVVIILIIALTVGAFVWRWEKNENKKEAQIENTVLHKNSITKKQEQQNQSPEKNIEKKAMVDLTEPFQYSKDFGFYGTLALTGYLDIKQKVCNPGDMCTKTVSYAYFVITSTNSDVLEEFLNENRGNSYVGDNSIGLGCYEQNKKQIYSVNIGNDGMAENIISGNDLQRLLQSNKNNTTSIQLAKPCLTGGGGAPECYSHFRQFKVNP